MMIHPIGPRLCDDIASGEVRTLAGRLSTSSSRVALIALLCAAFAAPNPASAKTWTVNNAHQLDEAFRDSNSGDTINIQGKYIGLLRDLPVLSGKNLTINGNGNTISGLSSYRGVFVLSGTITINNLKIDGMYALGGSGGNSYEKSLPRQVGSGGGGAAGLGAGLFVASGAAVIASNVTFDLNEAVGGHGGGVTTVGATTPGGGGGGYV